jgi:hypothetical protein
MVNVRQDVKLAGIKKMKSIKIFLAIVAIAVIIYGCNKHTNEKPNTDIKTELDTIFALEEELPPGDTVSVGSVKELVELSKNNPTKFENITGLEVKGEVSEKEWEQIANFWSFYLEEDGPHILRDLEMISFPNTSIIGDYAFEDCPSLETISFPNVVKIGNRAFTIHETTIGHTGKEENELEFYKLKSISFPKVTTIGASAFAGCHGLTNVSFPNAKNIDSFAFAFCEKLTSITFGAEILEFNDATDEEERTIFIYVDNDYVSYTENVTLHLTNPKEYAKANIKKKEWRGYKWKNILNK